MRLRIIDQSSDSDENCFLAIRLETDSRSKEYIAEYQVSGRLNILQDDIKGCFSGSVENGKEELRRNILDRLIAHGRYLGSHLIGGDFQLDSYRQEIETKGYSEVEVSVESRNTEFFSEFWEALILPDSKYILSSAAKSFVRRLIANGVEGVRQCSKDSVLEYGIDRQSPLSVLHCVGMDSSGGSRRRSSTHSYEIANSQLKYDGVVDYQLWPFDSANALERKLMSDETIHIFHYEGALKCEGEVIYLTFLDGNQDSLGEVNSIRLSRFCELLNKRGCGLLILSITDWLEASDKPSRYNRLNVAAENAIESGIPNVLGLIDGVGSQTSAQHFTMLYDNLLKGRSIAQATVETRKQILKEMPAFSCGGVLFVHYENQPVTFCHSPVQENDVLQTRSYSDVRGRLYGLYVDLLPPYKTISGDSKLLETISVCRRGRVAHICGGQGLGKTQLMHMLGFYFAQRETKFVFYFDYANQFYSVDDLQEMVASVLQVNDDSTGSDFESVRGGRYIVMLDNIDYPEMAAEERNKLGIYIDSLSNSNYIIVTSGKSVAPDLGNHFCSLVATLNLEPLSTDESYEFSRQQIVEQGENHPENQDPAQILSKHSYGNPFLIQRFAQLVSDFTIEELIERLEYCSNEGDISGCVDRFWGWQWYRLAVYWRVWLMLLGRRNGLLLEILSVVCDSKMDCQSVSELHALIGKPDSSFFRGIEEMERNGFLVRYPLGRMINPRCVHFIRGQYDYDNVYTNNRQELEHLVSRIVCAALAKVIPEVRRNSDPVLLQYLIVNRGQWAGDLETLWEIGEYGEFSLALSELSRLVEQENLSDELAEWAVHILSSTAVKEWSLETVTSEFFKSWIQLARLSIKKGGSKENTSLRQTAELCDEWIRKASSTKIERNAALFTSVIDFLQVYYRENSQWTSVRVICEIALEEYRNNEVWPLVVKVLNRLIECCYALDDSESAREFEGQLLSKTVMDDFDPAFKRKLLVKVIEDRILHKNFSGAQALLNEAYSAGENESQYRKILDFFQADIFYSQGKLKEAELIYRRFIEANDDQSVVEDRLVIERYTEIRQALGLDT